ncbi:HNH endonuclease domain-containing protein [Maribacter confluentis]|uniref:HNH endonuclease domain-containing protein n=1 Tax=Maribacter confluentis TaxID=1656093 RepID=A0ABT8RTT7_9FLAO|nr:HNH endonuclease domain-containing protein [Maribacter confluentis]MDO1514346.1 HNH endonuclease domain-containing protein [Maribacter confluentis]
MRQIKINNILRDEVKLFNDNLFTVSRSKGFIHPKTKLIALVKRIKPVKYKKYKLYVEKIINEYDDILNADPSKMQKIIKEFNAILPYPNVKRKITSKRVSFQEEVVKAMRYEDLRKFEFPLYLQNSNLKTCVYCNAQSTLTIEPVYYNNKTKKDRRGVNSKLQLDHFYPKSKYPFLSTSFFNLYPTCANCNIAKGEKIALFELYTTSDDLDVFNFWIDDKSILDYWLSLNANHLKVHLQSLDGDIKLLHNHNELFQIQKVYDAQIDVGEELIWKVKANPQSYRKSLNKTFSKIFPDTSVIDRMIIGNYSKPEETFKRPMSKYTQDIARQLKLI